MLAMLSTRSTRRSEERRVGKEASDWSSDVCSSDLLLVELHAAIQPVGVRIGADEEEERTCPDPCLDAGIVADAHGLELPVTFQRDHGRAPVNLDVGDALDAIDE